MLGADYFPELGPDLVAALAALDVQDFTHFRCVWVRKRRERERERERVCVCVLFLCMENWGNEVSRNEERKRAKGRDILGREKAKILNLGFSRLQQTLACVFAIGYVACDERKLHHVTSHSFNFFIYLFGFFLFSFC